MTHSNQDKQPQLSNHDLQDGRPNASTYVDYNETFTSYDQSRQPNGLNELLHIFSQTDTPLQEQRILEGGFGTGAYIGQMRHHVKTAYGVEASDEGYQQTLRKVNGATNVRLQMGNILDLSFPDDHFDAYMINQVAHHLDSTPDFPNLNIFLSECKRVLVSGGVLTINTCAQEQIDPDSGAFWHYKYMKKETYVLQARYIPIEELLSRLSAFGFHEIRQTILFDQVFQPRYYEDPTIALEPTFKQGDSVYSGPSPEEIEESDASIRAAIEDGSIYHEMKRAAHRAAEIGEAVIISARKP